MSPALRGRFDGSKIFSGSAWILVGIVVQAGFGFLFWLLASRVATASEVGRASALFTAIQFVNYASGMGLTVALARHATGTARADDDLFGWSIVATVVSSIVVGAGYLALVDTRATAMVTGNLTGWVVFCCYSAATSVSDHMLADRAGLSGMLDELAALGSVFTGFFADHREQMITVVDAAGKILATTATNPQGLVDTLPQMMRFRREGARRFLRYSEAKYPGSLLIGDCGSFTYRDEKLPPYTPADTLEFYADGGFTHGCSVDHIIFDFDEGEGRLREEMPQQTLDRYDVTLELASEFHAQSKRLKGFKPMGVVQGWSAPSMAWAASQLVHMGYDYLAVGGLVPLKVPQIHAALSAIRAAIPSRVRLHLLGFGKIENLAEFERYVLRVPD